MSAGVHTYGDDGVFLDFGAQFEFAAAGADVASGRLLAEEAAIAVESANLDGYVEDGTSLSAAVAVRVNLEALPICESSRHHITEVGRLHFNGHGSCLLLTQNSGLREIAVAGG